MSPQTATRSDDPTANDQLAEIRLAVRGSNINEETLLATDYLNHFNEAVMLLELLPEMPDFIDDVKSWRPKTYEQHFLDSGLSISSLAIQAYGLAPVRYRQSFDETIEEANQALLAGIERIETALAAGDIPVTQLVIAEVVAAVQNCNDRAGAIINATGTPAPIAEGLAGEHALAEPSNTLDQDDIDALFD
jgi:hypothetical protein